MIALSIAEEAIDSSGALSLLHAATDELGRRYGSSDDGPAFDPAELSGPRGVYLVARLEGDLAGGVGLRPISDAASPRRRAHRRH